MTAPIPSRYIDPSIPLRMVEVPQEPLQPDPFEQLAKEIAATLEGDFFTAASYPAAWYREQVEGGCSIERAARLRVMVMEVCSPAPILRAHRPNCNPDAFPDFAYEDFIADDAASIEEYLAWEHRVRQFFKRTWVRRTVVGVGILLAYLLFVYDVAAIVVQMRAAWPDGAL